VAAILVCPRIILTMLSLRNAVIITPKRRVVSQVRGTNQRVAHLLEVLIQ
jgi:hypothetical protein